MAKRLVRMRAPGEAPGLKQRRHAVRNPFNTAGKSWIFNAGDWVIFELSDDEKQFLDEYRNPWEAKLFDVADTEAEAAKIVMARKRQMAAARAKAFPAATLGEEGKVGSDDDILNLVTAKAAEKNVAESVVKLQEPDASLVADAEKALAEEAELDEQKTHEATIAFLSTYLSHDAVKEADELFGEKLSWIVANRIERLTEIQGVGKKTVQKIKQAIGA